jgi:biopolymer transport protein ExbD
MAMSVGGDSTEKPLSDINATPLVDVMLVLLIIFLIAVPVVLQTVEVKLPKVRFDATTTKPENVNLSVTTKPDGSCAVFWGMTPVTQQELLDRAVAKLKLEIDKQGDVNAPWKCVAGAIYNMQMAGFAKVGFISEPPPGEAVQRL